MTTQQLIRTLTSLFLFGALLSPALASAQSLGASATASVTTTAPAVGSVTLSASVMANAKAKADQEITRRVTALQALNTRIQGMQAVTATFKQNLASNIQNLITALGTLKAKIDADTDGATLKADVQTVTQSYRIYALVLPQTRIAAQADREVTIVGMMQQLGAKLQARITNAQNGGANVSAMSPALSDLATQIQNASSQAQAAVSAVAPLAPDQGNSTVMASNTATLKTGRSDLQAAQKDLVAGRKDIQTIVTALKSVKVSATASSTTSTSTH